MCTSVNVYVTQSGDVDERVAAEFFEGPPRARLSPLKLASRESEMMRWTEKYSVDSSQPFLLT